jgi:hypothetical protein
MRSVVMVAGLAAVVLIDDRGNRLAPALTVAVR